VDPLAFLAAVEAGATMVSQSTNFCTFLGGVQSTWEVTNFFSLIGIFFWGGLFWNEGLMFNICELCIQVEIGNYDSFYEMGRLFSPDEVLNFNFPIFSIDVFYVRFPSLTSTSLCKTRYRIWTYRFSLKIHLCSNQHRVFHVISHLFS